MNEYRISSGLCELMEFKLNDGKYFKDNPANKNSVVLNQEAVKLLNLKNPVGEKVVMHGNPMEVIGVVENFYYNSTAWQISPIVLTSAFDKPKYFYIRFDSNINKAHAAQLVLPVFHKFDPEFILNSTWSEDIYNGKFAGEKKMAKIIFTSTLLSLFITILGLFAIHSFVITQRIKEIGIRKVSGSSTWSVVALLTGKVVVEIGISAAIAIPIALYFGNHWLHNYSNRISIGVFLVLIPVVIHAAIALITTITVSYKAASRNPVESLRYE